MSILASIVVPTYRRPDLLDRCLASLVAQTFDADRYEIIVADDADDPGTAAQVERWRARTGNRPAIRSTLMFLTDRGRSGRGVYLGQVDRVD